MSNTRNFKPLTKAEPSDADLEAFASRRGVPTLSSVATEPKATKKAVAEAIVQPKAPPKSGANAKTLSLPTTKLALHLPQYLADDLKRRALDERCSVRYLILRAIRDAGFTIEDDDLVADGRRLR